MLRVSQLKKYPSKDANSAQWAGRDKIPDKYFLVETLYIR
jgi:hypothetical protein